MFLTSRQSRGHNVPQPETKTEPKREPADHFGDSIRQWGLDFYNLKYDCAGKGSDCFFQNTAFGCFLTRVTPFVSEQWKNCTWLMRNEAFPHLSPSNHLPNP